MNIRDIPTEELIMDKALSAMEAVTIRRLLPAPHHAISSDRDRRLLERMQINLQIVERIDAELKRRATLPPGKNPQKGV